MRCYLLHTCIAVPEFVFLDAHRLVESRFGNFKIMQLNSHIVMALSKAGSLLILCFQVMEVAGMGYDAKWRLDAYCPLITAFPSLGRLAWNFYVSCSSKKKRAPTAF